MGGRTLALEVVLILRIEKKKERTHTTFLV